MQGTNGTPASIRARGNHLKGQRSLYLRQHAHNPVDWYPWGEAALARAKKENKPIFLSIGYAACHWCHVMEREVFEKDDVAALLNKHFICIKVDREERPDLDNVYMTAVQMLTGSGGWPMSVFLTPGLKPFFGGTYFPHPTFLQLIKKLHEAYRTRRPELEQVGARLHAAIKDQGDLSDKGAVGLEAVAAIYEKGLGSHDRKWGGELARMKFPMPSRWVALLHHHRRTGDARHAEVVRRTLDRMGDGGLQDHVGGGFHRYTVEATWLVPHFEKMLYDNAQLASLYLEASVALARPAHARIARDTLDFMVRDMGGPNGGFYSSYDADSGGKEGEFYIWTPAQISAVAGAKDGPALAMLLGVTAKGNFEGRSIITRRVPEADVARKHFIDPAEVARLFHRWRPKLREARARRTPPGLDKKMVTSWNGMALAALARGAAQLGDAQHLAFAVKTADYLWKTHRRSDGKLHRSSNGGVAENEAVLDDYAFLALGLLELYQTTGALKQLRRARALVDRARKDFAHPGACFYHTPVGHEAPMGRQVEVVDGARPSGNSALLTAMMRVSAYTGEAAYRDEVVRCVGSQRAQMKRLGLNMAGWFDLAEKLAAPYYEVVVAGDPAAAGTRALTRAFHGLGLTHAVLTTVPAGGPDAATLEALPITENKSALGGKATAFVCQHGKCKEPTSDPNVLRKQLLEGWKR